MTDKLVDPRGEKKGEKAYVLGTIIMEPEAKTSGLGNSYTKLVIATSNGLGKEKDVIWNAIVMQPLREKLPNELFAKFRYAKFSGTATHREYQKNGETRTAHDLLVNSITLQDGTTVYEKEKKENADEDAPF